jgi:hypothetical protein
MLNEGTTRLEAFHAGTQAAAVGAGEK